jgi:hypothetical protein
MVGQPAVASFCPEGHGSAPPPPRQAGFQVYGVLTVLYLQSLELKVPGFLSGTEDDRHEGMDSFVSLCQAPSFILWTNAYQPCHPAPTKGMKGLFRYLEAPHFSSSLLAINVGTLGARTTGAACWDQPASRDPGDAPIGWAPNGEKSLVDLSVHRRSLRVSRPKRAFDTAPLRSFCFMNADSCRPENR